MNTPDAGVRNELASTLRIECPCDLAAVRAASLRAKDFLQAKGVPGDLLDSLELALVEAANNAVEYVQPEAQEKPVRIDLAMGPREIEISIRDHTPGFEWPVEATLPDPESEGGRGIFLIQSLVDRTAYFRSPQGNILVLAKAHGLPEPGLDGPVGDSADQLRGQIEELEATLDGMTEELGYSYETLTSIFRYGAELVSTQNVGEFAERLIGDLGSLTDANVVVLRLFNKEANALETFRSKPADGAASTAIALNAAQAGVEADAARTLTDVWFDPGHPLTANDPLQAFGSPTLGVCHPFSLNGDLLGTLTLARQLSEAPFRAAQVNLLQMLTDFLAIQVANERFLQDRMRSQMMRRELDIAAAIQNSLLPAKTPEAVPLSIAAVCESAREIGGDFYDIIPVGSKGLLFVICDVMGKGIPAAMMAVVLRSVLRAMPHHFDRPADLMMTLNRALYEDFSRVDMFATTLIVYADRREGTLTAANAGHCPLLIAQPGTQEITALGASNLPLGLLPAVDYTADTVALKPGARVLLYTDGLTELANENDELFEEERLRAWLLKNPGLDVMSLKADLIAELARFRGNEPARDDQTFILLTHGT